MEPDSHATLEAAFTHAVGLSPAARADYLAMLRRQQPGLGQALAALLAADAGDPDAIFAPVEQVIREFNQDSENYWIKRQVGAYVIESRIAAGGMGAVFLAHRADSQFEQRVAVKIMGVQLLATDAIRRFRVERQILAGLNHPHIAKLYDGGTTDNDLPYLVMELVDGIAIDRYCDQNRLDLRARLLLFRKVCAAVSYLHSNLVVHRDIKPSNILVDAAGEPKLLDFGIAKVLDEDVGLTIDGALALSPAYASPEQIRGDTISTASDVYSLGCLLYTLLTGMPPFPGDTTVAQLIHAVLEETPLKPSQQLGPGAPAASGSTPDNALAAHRGTSAAQLRKHLAGDLDNITLLAIQKLPERRYSSVESFSADIANYLEHRPVAARADSVVYAAVKFWQRHTAAVSAAAVAIVAVLGFSAVTVWQADRLQEERNRATREARTALEVANFMTDIFAVADPTESLGNRVTAREILDRAAQRIDAELGDQPEVKAQLMQIMGRVYRRLGVVSAAEPLLTRALSLHSSLYGNGHETLIDGYAELGLVRRQQGKTQLEEENFRRALALARAHPGTRASELARLETALAATLRQVGAFDESLQLLEAGLSRLPVAAGDQIAMDGRLAVQRELILLYTDMGDFAGANKLAARALVETRARYVAPHPEIARSLSDFGYVLHWYDDFEAALPLMEEALAMDVSIYGESHYTVIQDYYALGALYERHRKLDRARDYLHKVITLSGSAPGREPPVVANAYNDLANAAKRDGEYDQAARYYRKALAINRRVYGNEHVEVATNLSNQAILYGVMGDDDRAYRGLQEALSMRRRLLGDQHPHVAFSLSLLGSHLARLGRFDEAEPYAREALSLRESRYGLDHPMAAAQRARLVRILAHRGQLVEAQSLSDSALASIRRTDEPNQSQLALVLIVRGELLLRQARYAEALAVLNEAATVADSVFPPGTEPSWHLHLARGAALRALGKTDDARDYLRWAITEAEDQGRTGDRGYQQARSAVASLGKSPPG